MSHSIHKTLVNVTVNKIHVCLNVQEQNSESFHFLFVILEKLKGRCSIPALWLNDRLHVPVVHLALWGWGRVVISTYFQVLKVPSNLKNTTQNVRLLKVTLSQYLSMYLSIHPSIHILWQSNFAYMCVSVCVRARVWNIIQKVCLNNEHLASSLWVRQVKGSITGPRYTKDV